MKCSNCGAELDGKFCSVCGTPAPTEETPVDNNTAPNQPQPVDYNAAPNQPQPVDYNAATNQPQPVDYNAAPNGTSYGQQFTNQAGNGYTGQQFTNQPNTPAPNGKKPMSGGKIAIIVVSIVLGLLIILGIIVGVAACTIFKSVGNAFSEYADDDIDSLSSMFDDLDSYIDEYSSSLDSYSDYYYDDYDDVYDEITGFTFEWSDDYNGWSVIDYSKSDYETAKITLTIPSEFQGKPVAEIGRLYVYDNDSSENGYLKVVVPGSVKVIDDSSFAFLQDINEVVIEDGVTEIEEGAFSGDNDLTIMHIPASVTSLEESYIGYYCDENYDHTSMGKKFTMYCEKGSAAESYALENGFTIVYE